MLFIALYIFWLFLNARITLEIFLIGLPVTALVYLLSCRLLGYSAKRGLRSFSLVFYALRYAGILFWNIVLSNLYVMRIIFSPGKRIEPGLLFFRPELNTDAARFVLANSITLTPGTYTVGLKDGEFCVHFLDRFGAVPEELIFITELERMEAKYRG